MKTVAGALSIVVAALTCAPAEATCVEPDAKVLLGQEIAGCCNVINGQSGDAGEGLRWVSVSWEAPADGKLLVVSCEGAKVAETDALGYVESMGAAPRIGDTPTIEVTYGPATGTGVTLRSVALVRYPAGRPHVLWAHPTLDASWPPPNLGQSYEERTSWRFVKARSQIELVTVHTDLGERRRVRKLPIERYCFENSVWRYEACK